jgi:hypothetical protein
LQYCSSISVAVLPPYLSSSVKMRACMNYCRCCERCCACQNPASHAWIPRCCVFVNQQCTYSAMRNACGQQIMFQLCRYAPGDAMLCQSPPHFSRCHLCRVCSRCAAQLISFRSSCVPDCSGRQQASSHSRHNNKRSGAHAGVLRLWDVQPSQAQTGMLKCTRNRPWCYAAAKGPAACPGELFSDLRPKAFFCCVSKVQDSMHAVGDMLSCSAAASHCDRTDLCSRRKQHNTSMQCCLWWCQCEVWVAAMAGRGCAGMGTAKQRGCTPP